MSQTNITTSTGADGITTITWDMPGRSMNVISQASDAEFKAACRTAIADPKVKGVVITSAKPAFIAGADLSMMEGISAGAGLTKEQQAKSIFDFFNTNAIFTRQVEKCGKPFVAAISVFLLGFVGLVVSNVPYLVPDSMTVWQGAAAPNSQIFSLVGVLIMLPVILGYTAFIYWTFRGKMRHGEGYH